MAEMETCPFCPLGICKKHNACAVAKVHVPARKPGLRPVNDHPDFERQPSAARPLRDVSNSVNRPEPTKAVQQAGNPFNGPKPNRAVQEVGSPMTEALFRDWRYRIPLDPRKSRPLGPAMSVFFQQALQLVGGELSQMQEVVLLLAGEGGLLRITELVSQPFDKLTEGQLGRVFNVQILPFLKTITHPNLVNSVVLGPRLITIYNIIFNSDGQRAVLLFSAIARHLQTLNLVDTSEPPQPNIGAIDAIHSTLAALDKLIEVNTQAQVNDDLKVVAESLATILEEPVPDIVAFNVKPALKRLYRIRQRLGLGQELPQQQNIKSVGNHATFDFARERPGELSEDGPRHDNDKADIRNISILPTIQEIQSSRTEYLPLANPQDWHLDGLEGLLDRHFRLLREDTVGQLRDAAKFELERLQNPFLQPDEYASQQQRARKFVYHNVEVVDIAFDAFSGLEFALAFDQPGHLQRKPKSQRRDWWEGSKRFGHEALICLLSSTGSVTFFTVSTEPPRPRKDMKPSDLQVVLHKRYDLWSEPERAYAIAKPLELANVQQVLERYHGNIADQVSLVEFPGVLLPAFKPTLQAMQRMSDTLDLPFSEILAPVTTAANADREIIVPPPLYATKSGFRYNLNSITDDGVDQSLALDDDLDFAVDELAANSTLDHGQARAVVSALTRSLALIQGPPGTGKSYCGVQLIQVLLANKAAGDLGPIVCCCFTNHALDQSLERLVDEGVRNVVRIGGNSKSERLAQVNLRNLGQSVGLTKTESKDQWNLRRKVVEEAKEVNRILHSLAQVASQPSLEAHLTTYYPHHYEQLFGGVDADGFQTVHYHPGEVFQRWLRRGAWQQGHPRANDQLIDEHVESMSRSERMQLFEFWVSKRREELQSQLETALKSYSDVKAKLDAIRIETDLRVVRQANVIGITTSGLARNLDLLRRVNAKVLLLEEAGEILESHVLTALLPTIEHAILIGDHQQLRPHVQNYDLSTESRNGAQYALDVSLFERLVQPQEPLARPLPFCTLDIQRRMHNSISQLIRKTLYPQLQDAASVSNYPEVVGMKRRLFWMHHEYQENQSGDAIAMSHTNDYEIEMTAALVKHLVRQGIYAPSDIAVITPYLGQLRMIRRKLGSTFEILLNERDVEDLQREGDIAEDIASHTAAPEQRTTVARGTLLQALRVATVDNFQGEEAKVVIISLVRSNLKNKAGFLKTSNRINVLLSRAMHGMYIIGNAKTTEHIQMWQEVLQVLDEDGNFGDALQLCCPRHKDTPLLVKTPEDFVRLSPEAGCDLVCDKQLLCGHACTSKCHSDMLHKAVYCSKPCRRVPKGCTHPCALPCGAECAKVCKVVVEDIDIELDCGHHMTSLPCYQHQDPAKVTCEVAVSKTVPGCEHETTVPCHVDVGDDSYRCMKPCSEILTCGHQCRKPCYLCRDREDGAIVKTNHGLCTTKCDREIPTCSHRCKAVCHGQAPCPLCEAKCEVRCVHAACDKLCHEPCAPCAEEHCNSHCDHAECRMPRSAPCDWVPCSLRCTKTLACGCQCPSVCGEACPDPSYCQTCAGDDVRSLQADLITSKPYGEINLDMKPCIFTACGHVFTTSSLDAFLDMARYYEINPVTGAPSALKSTAEAFFMEESKDCPTCRGSLRNLGRYGRIVRRALLDQSAKKLTIWSDREHSKLAEQMLIEQDILQSGLEKAHKPDQNIKLAGLVSEQLRVVKNLRTQKRYYQVLKIRDAMQDFCNRLSNEEQPYKRVSDLVESIRRHNASSNLLNFTSTNNELQLREHLQANSLLLRCDIIMFSDVISVHNRTTDGHKKASLDVDLNANRKRCEALIKEAQQSSNLRQENEGRIFWARFAAMECGALDTTNEGRAQTLKAAALVHLAAVEEACGMTTARMSAGQTNPVEGLIVEAQEVRRMLEEGDATSEMRMVVAAMTRDLSGDVRWYRCTNSHLFTVGEGGRSPQLARCDTCGEGVGGPQPTAGVQGADELARVFGGLNVDGE